MQSSLWSSRMWMWHARSHGCEGNCGIGRSVQDATSFRRLCCWSMSQGVPGILLAWPTDPNFAWDVNVTEAELRDKLRCSDPDARAQWQGWIMAEARYPDVWRFHSLDEIGR